MEKKDRYQKSVSGCKVGAMLASMIFLISMSFPYSANTLSDYELCVLTAGHLGPVAIQDCLDEWDRLREELENLEEDLQDSFSFESVDQDDGASSAEGEEGIRKYGFGCGTGTHICRP